MLPFCPSITITINTSTIWLIPAASTKPPDSTSSTTNNHHIQHFSLPTTTFTSIVLYSSFRFFSSLAHSRNLILQIYFRVGRHLLTSLLFTITGSENRILVINVVREMRNLDNQISILFKFHIFNLLIRQLFNFFKIASNLNLFLFLIFYIKVH